MTIDTSTTSPNLQGSPVDLQDRAKQDLGQVTEKAKAELDAVTQRASEDAKELKHVAGEQVSAATEKAKSFATDQKSLAADQINGVASAITKVADELDGSDNATIARYARDLASGLSSFGQTVQDKDVDDLMGMAQDFGRKQPIAFLGAAALAGFVASRFALASAHRRDTKPAMGTGSQSGYRPSPVTGEFTETARPASSQSGYSPSGAAGQSSYTPSTSPASTFGSGYGSQTSRSGDE